MDLLLGGIIVWSGVHYIPGFMPDFRAKLIDKLGSAYRGVFALSVVLSIVLMVMGWKAAEVEFIYEPPMDALLITSTLMFISIYLFACSHGPSNVKRYIRHPMLTAVIIWGVAHLFSNGDKRSIILFGGMIIWAIAEIFIISKRDGEYKKPEPSPISKDIIKLVIAAVVYMGLIFGHPYFTGMPVVSM